MLSIKTSAVVITVQSSSSSSSLSSSSLPSSFLTSTTINNFVSSNDKLNYTRKQTQVFNNYKSTHHNSCTNTPIHIVIGSREQQTFTFFTFLAKTRKHPNHRYTTSSDSPSARTSFLLPQQSLVVSSTGNRLFASCCCSSSRRKQLFGHIRSRRVSCCRRCHY